MCKPNDFPTPRRVVISGAGPSGLLLALLLLKRNETSAVKYHVTLVDVRQDFGLLDPLNEMKNFRSWMIGLSGTGVHALSEIPELFQDYVLPVTVPTEKIVLHLGKKEINAGNPDPNDTNSSANQASTVDRNFVVASLARYMHDTYKDNHAMLVKRYDTKLMYVDHESQRVLVRSHDGVEEYIEYDLLVGCDGIRSVVREALVKKHVDFEMDVGDIFQKFKAVHVRCPPHVHPKSMHILPNAFPNMTGIALPETGGMLNISIGCARHDYDKIPSELKSSDPKVVAAYVKENFQAFEMVDYMDFSQQWVNSKRWNRTGCCHCNFYHSTELKICIMGDAAHATSPSIGQGMNTAFYDAHIFCQLLDQHKDNLDQTLESFSKERVKEGNALTDLAMHLYCLDVKHQVIELVHTLVRGFLSTIMPRFVDHHPQAIIGNVQHKLSDIYDLANRQGVIAKHRSINDKIRRDYFERTVGMVKDSPGNNIMTRGTAITMFLCVAAAVTKVYFA